MTRRFVGIDVGSKELVVVIIANGKTTKAKTFSNTPEGHAQLIKFLHKYKKPAQVCLEATGVYHFDLAVALHKADRIELMVANPKAAKHFADVLMKRSKTDSVDAGVLATYCQRMDCKAWQCPSQHKLELRIGSRRLVALKKQRGRAKNQLHALESTTGTPDYILDDTRQVISERDARIDTLQDRALAIISQDDGLNALFERLLSIKGVAEVSCGANPG